MTYDTWTPAGPAIAEYEYTDEHGELLFGVCRTEDKQFPQWRPDPSSPTGKRWKLNGVRKVLFDLPRVIEAVAAGAQVFICEGEKDAIAMQQAGVCATTAPGGARKWDASYSEALRGAQVIVVADHDPDGWAHARMVDGSLAAIAASVWVVTAAEGKDASDHLAAGHTVAEFEALDLTAAQPDWARKPGSAEGPAAPSPAGLAAAPVSSSPREQFPPPSAPMAVARQFAAEYAHPSGFPVLRHWRGEWMWWNGTRYIPVEEAWAGKLVYERLEHAVCQGPDGSPVPWAPNSRKVHDVLAALKAILLLPQATAAPSWLDASHEGAIIIPCANGLLDAATRELHPPVPAYFATTAIPFAYDQDAPEPVQWLRFLAELWPDDPDSIGTLQEWFGNTISGSTKLEKILLIIGPKRGGKGTIANVLEALVGDGNYAGPLLASLAGRFGLEPLLGKTLAVISDVRLGPRVDLSTLAERLLAISGRDSVDVDRKFKGVSTGRLGVRFMMLSNELPNFADVSGALSSRFVVLSLAESWLGREDTGLAVRLMTELPGILNWALDGLDRLTARGHLNEPESSRDAVIALEDAVSPMSAFIRQMCITGAGCETTTAQLYAAWCDWCRDNGREHPGTLQRFGRDIRAVLPKLKSHRPREKGSSWRDDTGPRTTILYGVALKPVPAPEPGEYPSGTRRYAYQPIVAPREGTSEVGNRGNGGHNALVRVPARPGTSPQVDATKAGTQGGSPPQTQTGPEHQKLLDYVTMPPAEFALKYPG